ncbi:HAMP domain-containing sensor histidine kinase [Brucella pseudogrignonensis]|uniref:sensor histidine kinase n=1 Tax=Brucella pseudogrignonensis TaxID=419475 RepID=UPI002ED707FF
MICCCLPPRHCRAIYSHLEESVNLLLSKHDRPLTTERQFADHVKHQLRNPQASLRPLLQMLQQAEQEDERMMILNNLVRSNDKALRLIEQLLQSGRVNHQDLAIGPVNLYDVAASILAELGETIRSKAQDVVLSGCETAWVKTDEALLRLLLENILENAMKYSPTSGRVHVVIAAACNNTWLVQVCDTGPGIPAHQAEAVFQRFFRIPGSKRPEGTGLGLTIAADAAKRLSAAIALGVPTYGYRLQA